MMPNQFQAVSIDVMVSIMLDVGAKCLNQFEFDECVWSRMNTFLIKSTNFIKSNQCSGKREHD